MADIETFHWKISPGMKVDVQPSAISVQFGDGYEQRRDSGLNSTLKKYNCTVKVNRHEASILEDFLTRHRGYKAFLWTPPYQFRQIRVVCRKWSATVDTRTVSYTLNLDEVVI